MFRLLLKWFRARFSKPRSISPSVPAAPTAPDWSPEYQTAWAHFLRTAAGMALMQRLRAVQALIASNSCKPGLYSEHRSGTGNGWDECRLWLESLSRSSRVNEPSGPGRSTTDMPAPGEATLHELLSP